MKAKLQEAAIMEIKELMLEYLLYSEVEIYKKAHFFIEMSKDMGYINDDERKCLVLTLEEVKEGKFLREKGRVKGR